MLYLFYMYVKALKSFFVIFLCHKGKIKTDTTLSRENIEKAVMIRSHIKAALFSLISQKPV